MSKSIIKSLFVTRADAINSDIVKNHEQIIAESLEFSAIVENAHADARKEMKREDAKAGTNALREAIMQTNFAWIYDAIGTPNKQGVANPIMSNKMTKIKNGMMFLSDENNAILFRAWAENPTSKNQGVTDFANLKRNIQPKVEKIAQEKNEKITSENETSESEKSDTTTAPSLADIAKKLVADLGKKEANKLSILIAELVEDDLSDADIEKMVANM